MKRHGFILTAITIAATVIPATVITGCRTSRHAAATGIHDVSAMTITERARDIAAGYLPWTQLNLPVKVSVKSPQKLSVSGRIYMRRDRDIYVTLRVLGMEVANMYVSTDSVFAADKLHKCYIAEPIKDIFAGASLSIGDLQDALLGRAFVNNRGTYSDTMTAGIMLTDSPDGTWTLTPKSKINGTIEYQFHFSKSSNTLMSLTFNTGDRLYGCTYSDPADIDGSHFMRQFSVSTRAGNTPIDASLTYDFDKVKWEVPSSARWRTPSGYTRITPQSLAKTLSNK